MAGGDACCDLGLEVIVDHGGGFSTVYGHLSELRVSEGQEVAQGDLLGLGGDTGITTGKHLHFELRQGEQRLDPLRYLSVSQRSAFDVGTQAYACQPGTIPIDPSSTVRLSFLPTVNVELSLVSVSVQAAAQRVGAPAVQVAHDGNLGVLTVGAAPLATGDTFAYNLQATLQQAGAATQSVACTLEVRTLATLANEIEPDLDAFAADDEAEGDAGAEVDAAAEEAGSAGPTATPARVAAPTRTATATVGPPAPATFTTPVPTATSAGPQPATFRTPVPTTTSAAPKPATFTAPKPAFAPTTTP
jgi:pyruvate/2-oxoglutarate dehydrogenase complex dihydrolipoamide acyltransferase (E2) component